MDLFSVDLFTEHPKRGKASRGLFKLLLYSAYDRGRQLLHRKTKLNQIQQNTRINLI